MPTMFSKCWMNNHYIEYATILLCSGRPIRKLYFVFSVVHTKVVVFWSFTIALLDVNTFLNTIHNIQLTSTYKISKVYLFVLLCNQKSKFSKSGFQGHNLWIHIFHFKFNQKCKSYILFLQKKGKSKISISNFVILIFPWKTVLCKSQKKKNLVQGN